MSTLQTAASLHLKKNTLLFSEATDFFDKDRTIMRNELGGKGAGLAEMTHAGINVPPGFTLPTSVCRDYYQEGGKMPPGLMEDVLQALGYIEKQLNTRLGDQKKPLLLSVRSGAKFSMPGMMDTILNLGLNDTTVEALAKLTNNSRFAWDSYRRFIQMFGNVVFEIPKDKFENIIEHQKEQQSIELDTELSSEQWQSIVTQFKALIKQEKKMEFPQDGVSQLRQAIEAVFKSWNTPRAIYYRHLNKIDPNLGTAVNIQSMVFGNLGNSSATGVCFTRNPSNGAHEIYGEFLTNAQGEDVVAGIRTPKPIYELATEMPDAYAELKNTLNQLEIYYKDMQDVEFTIQEGQLFILQTRNAKRTAAAAVKVAVDMVNQQLLTQEEAIASIEPTQLSQLLLPSFDHSSKQAAIQAGNLLSIGLHASPGAAEGEVVFHPDESEWLSRQGKKNILIRVETCPDDIHGIVSSQGVITSRGGMTSHAAVVARGMGKPCIVGCEALKIDLEKEQMTVAGRVIHKGDWVSMDGSTGEIFLGEIATKQPQALEEFNQLLAWSDQVKKLSIRVNADTPEDARLARQLGAQGVGLCRTEHMFMHQDRLPVVQGMILASSREERQEALEQLLPMQRQDFYEIFQAMDGLPVTIRLLDPPLHEFLPKKDDLLIEITTMKTKAIMKSKEEFEEALWAKEDLLKKINELHETNPMMGLRGCRLGLLYPEINQMQVRAIFEAACQLKKEGYEVLPEIMIPLVGHCEELKLSKLQLETIALEVMQAWNITLPYQFGTMIEIPRACLIAKELAGQAQFFSFGTNDLTQMTLGYSRDDAESKFLQKYIDGVYMNGTSHKILNHNPFEILDEEGVGKLMEYAVIQGRLVQKDLKMGICGEHGGDPTSIAFANKIGLTYVSCSPYRVPIARLAAAQANLIQGLSMDSRSTQM